MSKPNICVCGNTKDKKSLRCYGCIEKIVLATERMKGAGK